MQPLRLVVAPEAGFRYTYMRTELEVRRGPTVDSSESWVDPLIGSRISLELTDRWAIVGEGDFGGFGVGSDFTGTSRPFSAIGTTLFGRPTTFLFGYRALHQDYDHGDFAWDVTMHGPMLGGGAVLSTLKASAKEVDDDARASVRGAHHACGVTAASCCGTAPGGCFADLVHAVIREARPT